MSVVHVYEVLADAFSREQVDTCFALLGDANMHWSNALHNAGCRFIYVRDEHCAVAAAMSWSRFANRVGIATVTCGPGLTQIMTALPAAVRAHIPLVIFAGEAPLHSAWYNQAIEQGPFVEATGALYRQLHSIESMADGVEQAFTLARSRSIPVVLGVPLDLQEQVYPKGSDPFRAQSRHSIETSTMQSESPALPDQKQIQRIAQRIQSANRIVVMAGRGVYLSNATDACIELADKTDALLATTLPARGLFRDHPFSLGIAGGFATDTARTLLQKSDLVLAVGTRLAQHNSDSGKLFSADKVVHIDTAPRETSQGRLASSEQLTSDAKAGIEALIVELDQPASSSSSVSAQTTSELPLWRTAELAQTLTETPADSSVFERDDNYLDPRDVVTALDQLLPEHWTTVNSSGHCSYFFAQMPRRPVEHFLTIREFGAIGNGLAFAIGAAVAKTDKPVVLFDGDGSLLMHIQEFETILRHKLNLLICLLNDGAYGSEIHKLRADGMDDAGAFFGRCDFAKIAAGFGAEGQVFDRSEHLDQTQLDLAMQRFITSNRLTIWDFHVSDKIVSPVIQRSHG